MNLYQNAKKFPPIIDALRDTPAIGKNFDEWKVAAPQIEAANLEPKTKDEIREEAFNDMTCAVIKLGMDGKKSRSGTRKEVVVNEFLLAGPWKNTGMEESIRCMIH